MDEETTLTPETDDTEETENSESVDEEIEVSLADEIIAEFTELYKSEDNFNPTKLSMVVRNDIAECVSRRHFPRSYSDEQINKWLAENKSCIMNLVGYDYNKDGVEGQTSHSESGVVRNYVDRNSYFNWIIQITVPIK
jgi:hypothetical protein